MIHSRATHRRHRAASTQRLGVESMEGRLMLAATALEFAPVELQAAQFAVEVVQQSTPPAGPAVSLTQLSEGGFITNQLSAADSTGIRFHADFGSGFTGDSLNGLFLANSDASPTSSGVDHDAVDSGELYVAGDGLQPVSVLATQNNAGVTGGLESRVVHYNGGQVDADEGGPIPISAILASRELERGRELGPAMSVKSLAATASSDRAISGEWARAMVFEMAGGEPDGVGHSAAGERVQLSPTTAVQPISEGGGPLSSVGPYRPAGQVVGKSTGAAKISAATLQQANESDRLSALLLGGVNSAGSDGNVTVDPSHSAALAARPQAAGEVGGAAGQGATAACSPSSALEAAFDEIGGSTQSVFQSLADDGWRRSLGAAPLLMVLALERIATGNSRRSRRDAAAVPVRRPRLNRVAADAERA